MPPSSRTTVAAVAVGRLQRLGPVGGGGAGAELARLGDGAAGQLRAADPRREAEVVLDPARGPGLAAEHGALDHQRVEPLGGAVDGGAEPGRAAAEDQQVDLLAVGQLQPDPQRPRELAVARPLQLGAARQPHQRQLLRVERRRSPPPPPRSPPGRASCRACACGGRTRAAAASPPTRAGRAISTPIPWRCCSSSRRCTKAESSRSESGPSSNSSRRSDFALDRDVAHRLGDDGGEEDGLAGEQVHLAEEAGGAVADDLVPGGVGDRGLALDDGDERVGRVADLEQLLADLGGPLLAVAGQRFELGAGEDAAGRIGHEVRLCDRAGRPNCLPYTRGTRVAGCLLGERMTRNERKHRAMRTGAIDKTTHFRGEQTEKFRF